MFKNKIMNTKIKDKIVPTKIEEYNYEVFRKCIHDIRDQQRLNKDRLVFIQQLPCKEKMEIIVTYDKLIEWFELFLDTK